VYRSTKKKEPLYAMIKGDMRLKIERGFWAIGYRLPSEEELQKQYQVSRGTIRQALADLESDGLIERRAARGTVVTRATPKFERTLSGIASFTQQMTQAGLEPTTRILEAKVIPMAEAPKGVQEAFELSASAEVVQIKRIRSGNGLPFTIHTTYLLLERCPDILQADLHNLFKVYEERYGIRLVAAKETLQVSEASLEEAELLQVNQGTPVVIRERVSYDESEQPFEVLYAVDRGTRFQYRYLIFTDLTNVPEPVEREFQGTAHGETSGQ
jgi:GntR family transcriptional regulator